jgi:paraquat-inducible protein B
VRTLALGSALLWSGHALADPAQTAQLTLDRLLPGQTRERPVAAEDGVRFAIRFAGAARGLEHGSAVEINAIRVGGVRSATLEYEPARRRFVVAVEIALRPEALPPIDGIRPRSAEETVAAMDALVRAGLRARVGGTRLVGGDTVIALAMVEGTAPAALGRVGGIPEIPAAATRADEAADRVQDLLERLSRAPVEEMVADLQQAMAALKALATGPELRDALAGLRDGTAELRTQVARLGARADPVLNSLNDTVRAANRTLGSVERQLGERSPLAAELNAVLRELNGAARSMRLMAEYLERNPDALLRGKSDSRR